MEENSISISALAERTELSSTTIHDILSDKHSTTLDDVLKLCLALDIDISLNAANPNNNESEIPEVLLCEEPVVGSDVYLLHTVHPHSLWLCEVLDDDEENTEDEKMVEFKSLDGYEENWRITLAVVYEAGSEEELAKASERCSTYLQSYLCWEDEDLRKAEGGTFN